MIFCADSVTKTLSCGQLATVRKIVGSKYRDFGYRGSGSMTERLVVVMSMCL